MRSVALPLSAAGVAIHALPALSAHLPALSDRLGIRRRTGVPGTVALTFDDGPHPVATLAVLALLTAADARATFFLVGEQVRADPGLAREIDGAGHAIGLHGDTHRNELRLAPKSLATDRARGLEAIHDATGVEAVIHRPPHGAVSAAGLAHTRRAGMSTVLWSRWGRDWRARATPETITRDVLGAGPPDGDIILLHDADHYATTECWHATLGALPAILEACALERLTPVTL